MMKNAKAIAGEEGRLIVGILTDEATMERKTRPALSFSERMLLAESIKYADVVVPQATYSPIDNVKRIKPDILMESTSHSEEDIKKVEKIIHLQLSITKTIIPICGTSDSFEQFRQNCGIIQVQKSTYQGGLYGS